MYWEGALGASSAEDGDGMESMRIDNTYERPYSPDVWTSRRSSEAPRRFLILSVEPRRIQLFSSSGIRNERNAMNHGQIVSFTVGVRRNGEIVRGPINSQADIHLFGQEVNPETFAVCKSDLFMKSKKGEDAERIAYGTTLSSDRHAGSLFD